MAAQHISLKYAKHNIRHLLLNIKKLEEIQVKLHAGLNTISKDEWKSRASEALSLKQEISSLLQTHENNSHLELLKQQIAKRKRKRLRIRRRKSRQQLQRKSALDRRNELHKIIDENIEKAKLQHIQAQQSKESAEYAKWVLSNVTRKKADAQKYIRVLNSLKELRKARQIAARNSSSSGADDHQSFDSKINALLAVWADAVVEYETEEIKLKSILNDSHKSIEDQWNEILFGVTHAVNSNTTTNIDETDFAKFLEIRRGWDSCVVSKNFEYGSYIPTGWILPPKNPLEAWKIYRK